MDFPAGITGADLGRRAHTQATRFGAEFVTQRAMGLRIDGQYRFVQLADGREVSAHVVLLAPGVQYRKLGIPGADRLTGRGIYYGAALVEASSCKDEEVFVVGGANSAGQAALHFAKFACKVTMLVRGKGLAATMSKYLIDEIERTSNIVVETRDAGDGGGWRRAAGGLAFARSERRILRTGLVVIRVYRCGAGSGMASADVFCGTRRGFCWRGRIYGRTGRCREGWHEQREPFLLETSVPGVFVAGDVRHGSVKRVASAVGEGSIAVQFVHQYLAGF